MPYRQRLEWAKNTEYGGFGFQEVPVSLIEGDSCFAYVSQMWGTPHTETNALFLRFEDGTMARLPLPGVNANFGSAAPDTMAFLDHCFVYAVAFEEAEVVDGRTIHEAGIYYYTVDLTAKTVSLTIL